MMTSIKLQWWNSSLDHLFLFFSCAISSIERVDPSRNCNGMSKTINSTFHFDLAPQNCTSENTHRSPNQFGSGSLFHPKNIGKSRPRAAADAKSFLMGSVLLPLYHRNRNASLLPLVIGLVLFQLLPSWSPASSLGLKPRSHGLLAMSLTRRRPLVGGN